MRSVPRYVSPLFGARYPVQSGQVGARRSPISPVYGWVLSLVSEARAKLRIFNIRRSMGPRGAIYSSGEVSVFVVLVWRLSLDL